MSREREVVLSNVNIFLGHSAKINWPKMESWSKEEETAAWKKNSLMRSFSSIPLLTPTLAGCFQAFVFSSFHFEQVPGALVFIIAYGGRSDQSQLSTDNSRDRHWKGNTFIFLSSWPTFLGRGPRKPRSSSWFAGRAMPPFIKLTMVFITFPLLYQNMNLPTQGILRFCCVFNHLV